MTTLFEYIPIGTTLFSLFFTAEIAAHYQQRKKGYLLWWTIGVVTFGLGTLTESLNVLAGWSPLNFKVWYITGALLGGFPLAQGTVFLLMGKRFARISSVIAVSVIVLAAICVILSPLTLPVGFEGKLTGKLLSWEWVRYFSPVINAYAFIFLVGGAVVSAKRYSSIDNREIRFIGNVLIAVGGLLPGIGGMFTRMGYVNVLFITEFIGLILIYSGYRLIKRDKRKSNTRVRI